MVENVTTPGARGSVGLEPDRPKGEEPTALRGPAEPTRVAAGSAWNGSGPRGAFVKA